MMTLTAMHTRDTKNYSVYEIVPTEDIHMTQRLYLPQGLPAEIEILVKEKGE